MTAIPYPRLVVIIRYHVMNPKYKKYLALRLLQTKSMAPPSSLQTPIQGLGRWQYDTKERHLMILAPLRSLSYNVPESRIRH